MLKWNDVSFAFAKAETLKNISLEIEQGTHVAVIGESGCGKSTLLDMTYGLLQAKSGSIYWNDEELLGSNHHLVPGHPMMKYVPQEFDLMPFTTVFENVGEHLSIQIDHRADRIAELLDVVDMQDFKDRKVKTLSGGQKQRVAIAKALAQEPQLLLLDEPFSHIDNFRKNALRRKLFQYLEGNNISCLMATHDKDDVLSFCHKTVVMKEGAITDYRTTQEVYKNPENLYGASLFDEATLIPKEWLDSTRDVIAYPQEIKVATTGFEVVVRQSFFQGADYLVLGVRDDQEVFFRSAGYIPKDQSVVLHLES